MQPPPPHLQCVIDHMDIPLPEDFQIHHRNLVPPTNQNTKKKEAEEEKAETFSATVGESLATRIDLTKE